MSDLSGLSMNDDVSMDASRNWTGMLDDVSMAARDIQQAMDKDVPVGTLVDIGEERERQKVVMGRMLGALGKMYKGFKEYSASLGLVPPTPARITSTPAAAPASGDGEPPKVTRIVDSNNRCFSPILPPGLDGKATVDKPGKVWMDFRKPPPGYAFIPKQKRVQRWDVGPSGQYHGRERSKGVGVVTPSLPVAGPSRPRVDTVRKFPAYDLRERIGDKAGSMQDGNRVDKEGEDRASAGQEEEEHDDQMRMLGGACGKCREAHDTEMCPYNPWDLKCSYPPCTMRSGHVAGACHELTKICYLSVCNRARGHRASCHFEPEGRAPYGTTVRAAEELRQVFKEHQHLLTFEEKSSFGLLEGAGRQGGGPDRRVRDAGRRVGPYSRR